MSSSGLDADREPHQVRASRRRRTARRASSWRVRGRRGMDRRLRTSPTLARWLNSSRPSMKRLPGLEAALDPEREDRALAVRAGTGRRVPCHGLDFRPGYATHSTSSRPSSHSATACAFCAVPLHAQRQRLEALQEQERVERRHRRADVAQQLQPGLQDVLRGPQRLGQLREHEAVVARVGLGETREAAAARRSRTSRRRR